MRYLLIVCLFLFCFKNMQAQKVTNWENQYPELAARNNDKWVLKSATNIKSISRVMEVGIDLNRKSIVGYGGCNPFQINIFNVRKKKDFYVITTAKDAITENLCTDNSNENERQLISNLKYDRLYVKITDDTMTITNGKKVQMTFHKARINPLYAFMSKYYWKVIQLEGDSTVLYQSYFKFDFVNSKLIGDAGCGPFEVDFEISPDEDEISFTNMKYTNIGCDNNTREFRSQYFIDLLSNTTYSFDVADQVLNLYKDNRIVLMLGFMPKGF